MVFNLEVSHKEKFNDVKLYTSATYEDKVYGIWIFEDGEFWNEGDGGFINWAFKGNWERLGEQKNHVVFNGFDK